MKKSATGGRNATITKKFKVILVFIFLLMGIPGVLAGKWFEDKYKEESEAFSEKVRWNSDANLVDDRIPEDYPVFYVISPTVINGSLYGNVMAMYNDGTYISELFQYAEYDDFQERLLDDNAFWMDIFSGYSEYKDEEGTHIVLNDMEPADIREAYLLQYEINDFSLSTEVDMSSQDSGTFYIFGVTYDDSGAPYVHMYYSKTNGSETMVSSEEGYNALEAISSILSKDILQQIESVTDS